VVTVTAVIAAGAALFLAVTLAHERGRWREPGAHGEDLGRFAASRVLSRWPSEKAIQDEVTALESALHVDLSVHRWDGAPLTVGDGPPPPPLSPQEQAALLRDGFLARDLGRLGRPRELVFPLRVGPTPVAYLALVPPGPPHPPGPHPLVVTLLLVLVGAGVAAPFLGASIVRPLDQLARTARALGSGDLSARTGISRRDEVGTVAQAFDDMADRVMALLRGQTELIANVAHELRTPLARIRVALDLADDGDAAVARESLAEIAEDLAELESLVNDVLASARMDLAHNSAAGAAPTLHRTPLELGAVLTQAADRLRHRYPDRAVQLQLGSDLPAIEGDAVLLRRALDNLLDNARKYSPTASEIRLRAARNGDQIVVEVIDHGEGIAPADLERLFTPFFRADRSRTRATGGVGLGLALSKRIVEAHGGTVAARSAPGEGTTMTVTLPAVPQRPRTP
jgi:signal transduction histidine kinase